MVGQNEIKCEKQWQYCASQENFEPYASFTRLDWTRKGFVTQLDLYLFLRDNGILHAREEDTELIVAFFDLDNDLRLNYSDYLQIVLSCEDGYLWALAS